MLLYCHQLLTVIIIGCGGGLDGHLSGTPSKSPVEQVLEHTLVSPLLTCSESDPFVLITSINVFYFFYKQTMYIG